MEVDPAGSPAAPVEDRQAKTGPAEVVGSAVPHGDHLRSEDRDSVEGFAAGTAMREPHGALSAASHVASRGNLGEDPEGVARASSSGGPHRLGTRSLGLLTCPGKKGGEETGPSPVDRGRPGTKHHRLLAESCG